MPAWITLALQALLSALGLGRLIGDQVNAAESRKAGADGLAATENAQTLEVRQKADEAAAEIRSVGDALGDMRMHDNPRR